jgi:hypothetical protein
MNSVMPFGWAWPVTRVKMTGRIGFRIQKLTGKVVLQVEAEHQRFHVCTGALCSSVKRWRDATDQDVLLYKHWGKVRS